MEASSILFLNIAPQADYGAAKADSKIARNDRDDKGFERALDRSGGVSGDIEAKASDKDRRADAARKSEKSDSGVLHLPSSEGSYVSVSLSDEQLAQIANMDRVSLVSPEILEQFGGLANFMDAIRSLIPGNPALGDVDLAALSEQVDAFSQMQLGAETFPHLIAVNLSPAQLSALSNQADEQALASGVFTLMNTAQGNEDIVHVLFVPDEGNTQDLSQALQDFLVSTSQSEAGSQNNTEEVSPSEQLLQMLQQTNQNNRDMASFKKWLEDAEMSEELEALEALLSDAIQMGGNLGDQSYGFQSFFSGGGFDNSNLGSAVSAFAQQHGGANVSSFLSSFSEKNANMQGGLLMSGSSASIAEDILALSFDTQAFTSSATPVTNPSNQSAHAHGILGAQKAGQTHQSTQMLAAMVEKAVGNGGNQKLSVLLNPPELGRVQLDVEMDAKNQIKISMVTEKDAAYMLLQRDTNMLEQTLQNAGLDVDAGDIDLSMAGQGFSFDHEQGDNQFEIYHNNGGSDSDGRDVEDVIEASVDFYRDSHIGHWRYDAIV